MKPILGTVLSLTMITMAFAETPIEGNGNSTKESRTLAPFDSVRVQIGADVTITIGKTGPLTIEAEENILPLIETTIEKGKLVISSARSFSSTKPIKITGSAPNITGIELLGSGDINVTALSSDSLAIDLNGSGNVIATGKSTKLKVDLKGSGNVQCYGLAADAVTVEIKGSGNAEVAAESTLIANVIGSGDCNYKGSPKVTASAIGSGSIQKYDQ